MRPIKDVVKTGIRTFGYDIVPHPRAGTLGEHLVALFSALEINCVLDVGAHDGEYGRFLRDLGYRGDIVSFEPVAASFTALEQRRAGDARWRAWRLALGVEEGRRPINVTEGTEFSSLLSPNAYGSQVFGRRTRVERVEWVEVARLARVFTMCIAHIRAPRVYLKADTQGGDLDVLEGAGASLADISACQVEASVQRLYGGMRGYVEVISRMNELGFELTGLFPVSRDRDLRLIEVDCVMRRTREAGTGYGSRERSPAREHPA